MLPCPFPTTITITPRATMMIYTYIIFAMYKNVTYVVSSTVVIRMYTDD